MATPDPLPSNPLDYHKADKAGEPKGCLGVSIALGVMVALLVAFVLWAMLSSEAYGWAAACAGGTGLLIAAAVLARKYGMSVALAITLASVCTALLMFGLCAGAIMQGGGI